MLLGVSFYTHTLLGMLTDFFSSSTLHEICNISLSSVISCNETRVHNSTEMHAAFIALIIASAHTTQKTHTVTTGHMFVLTNHEHACMYTHQTDIHMYACTHARTIQMYIQKRTDSEVCKLKW